MGKKILVTIVLALSIALSVSGCFFGGKEFEIVSQHREGSGPAAYSLQTAADYDGLRRAAYEFISKGARTGVIRLSGYDGNAEEDLEKVCIEIANDTAIGQYGIYYLSGVTNKIVSYYEAKISATYKITAEEMKEISFIYDSDTLESTVDKALQSLADSIVLYIVPEAMEHADAEQYIRDEFYKEPARSVFMPGVTVLDVYPTEDETDASVIGKIMRVELDYPLPAEEIVRMREETRSAVEKATDEISGGTAEENVLAAVNTIIDGVEYSETPTGEQESAVRSTVYGALVDKKADSEGLASAFKALCDDLKIECVIVRGGLGGSAHFWNIVRIGREYYHVDPAGCIARSYGECFLKNDDEMPEGYSWEREKYPVCSGNSDFSDLLSGNEE